MLEIELDEVPEGKVYKTTNIGIASFFGGWPVGAYLISENFKVLGDRRKAIATWVVAASIFIIMVAIRFVQPVAVVPGYVYSILLALLAGASARYFQSAKINEHIEKGGDVYSNKRLLAVTLIGLAITAVLSLALFFIEDNMFRFN
jgi:hypothetical protein